MTLAPVTEIKVGLDFADKFLSVGRLANRGAAIYFEYDADFIDIGFEISPLHLGLRPGLRTFERSLFDGLPGVFYDSLPDGWGRLLLDRALRRDGVAPDSLSPLDRLAYVGQRGMGALSYEPDHAVHTEEDAQLDLDDLAFDTGKVLSGGGAGEVLQALIDLNGSSAGARPKAMIAVDKMRKQIRHGVGAVDRDFEPWLVKFPNAQDGEDTGAIEYVYALMAKSAGVELSEAHLFPAKRGAGYFASRRFDRDGPRKWHVHTAGGLLHSDFRHPALDYEDLLALTEILTRDRREVEKMFRIAVFNVLAHNRDDHAKNFSFLMDEKGAWRIAPAYDLTFSFGPGGEQSSTVMGEGKNLGRTQLIELGRAAKITQSRISEIIAATSEALRQWRSLAGEYGVAKENVELVEKFLRDVA